MGFHSILGKPNCQDIGGVKYAEYALFHVHQVLPPPLRTGQMQVLQNTKVAHEALQGSKADIY